MILIGDGAHARDIAETLDNFSTCPHSGLFEGYGPYIIGINDPQLRAELAKGYGWDDESWVHPTAFRGPGCAIGAGTHVNYAVAMTRTKIGKHCTIAPGVTICGDVTIGDRVFIGAGSTICDRVTISDDATVGAGAVVLPETIIPAGETWVGVPARKVRP